MRLGAAARSGLLASGVAAAVLGLWAFVERPAARRRALEAERDLLAATAHALAADLADGGLARPDVAVRVRTAGRVARTRLTVIGEDDRVVAESGLPDERAMDDHGHRPEVLEARASGRARTRRMSLSLTREMEYAAERIPGSNVVVRAARPADEVDADVAGVGGVDPLFAAALIAAAGIAGAAVGRRRGRSLDSLSASMAAFGRGDVESRAPPPPASSLRTAVDAWNATAESVAAALGKAASEHARLSSLLDGMPEAVLVVDHEENVRFLNEAARSMLRVPDGEALEGRPLHRVLREPRALHVLRAALRDGEEAEAEVAWGDAPPRLVRFHAAPVRGGGPGAFLLARDISTLRRLERMRSDFVANVSHELRTPIAAIAGAAETLAEGALADGDAGPRFVDTIRRHAERLRVLVDDLLTLSRLESAPETIERVPVDLAHVVRQACDAVAARAKEAGVAVEVEANGAARILGDPEALRRLVDNLVVNAVTYTPSGGRVAVRLRTEAGHAVLTVSDTGIGVAPEHLDRIFERFYRVDKARSRAKGGTGLGLAIVKHSVNLHEGEIRVESRLGRGSTFTVSIPVPPEGATLGAA